MLKNLISINEGIYDASRIIIADNLDNKLNRKLSNINFNNDLNKEFSDKELKEIVYNLSSIDGLINISLLDRADVEFERNDSIKKLFLIHLSKTLESPISMASAINTMYAVDELEENANKNILEFNTEEIRKSVIDLFKEIQYHKVRYQINILSKYQNFYKEQVSNDAKWEMYKDAKVLKDIVGEEVRELTLTKKDLINLANVVPNIQDSIIPLLIFEGVSFSKVDDIDELRYLKHTDLKGTQLIIEGNGANEDRKRVIDLTPEVATLVKEAINQDVLEVSVRGEVDLVELQNTEYILRPSVVARKKKNIGKDSEVISYRGAYSRVNTCKEYIEALLYDIKFTPKTIETHGKISSINRFLNEGYEEIESIIMTLKRFGSWYAEKDGRRDPKNAQQINRLRKVWQLHS